MDTSGPMTASSHDFADWVQAFRLGDDESTTARMVLQLNLYIKDAWTVEARTRVADVARDFVDRFREFIKFTYAHDPTGEFYEISPFGMTAKNEPEEFLLRRANEGDEALLCYVDIENEEEAGEVDFFFVSGGKGSELIYGDTGLLQIGLPMRAFDGRVERVSSYYTDVCEMLKPLHGSAGFGLTTPVYRGWTYTLALQNGEYHDAAKAFPCMEHNAQEDTTNDPDLENGRKPENGFGDWLRTTGWMTVVGDPLLERIGGRNLIAKILHDEGIDVRAYEGGLAIVAGEIPILGHKDRGPIPPSWGTISRLLKPIRCKLTLPAMLFSPTAYQSYAERDAAFAAWRERFDRVEIQD